MRRNLLVLAVLVGLGLGAWWYLPRVAEPAVTVPRHVAEVAVDDWPQEPALTLSLKVVPGSLPVTQALFEDGAMIWSRRHPDGSDEQWLLTENGTRRYRGRDGHEWTESGPASHASLSPHHGTDIELVWSSLLFSLVGVDSAHAQTSPADATNSNDNGAGSNENAGGSNENGGGSNNNGPGSNENGAGSNNNGAGSNDNGAGSNQNGGGSNDNGMGSNDNGNGSNDNGAGSNENGGGSNENGGGSNDNGGGSNDNGGGSNGNGGAAPPMPVAPPGGGGSGQGDPHYVMADGRLLSTQHAGEFLALTDGSDLNIQVRQEPWANSDTVAGITAIAIGAGTSRVEVRVRKALRVRVDGVDHPATDGFTQSALNAGAVLGVWRNQQTISTVAVVWADGSFVQVRPRDGWIDFSYQIAGLADGSKHLGLLGSADGDPVNDLRRRDGLIAEDTESGRAEFIESWRLRADEARFDYADGESTASFQIADFPRQHDAPDATAIATASARCRAAGVENPAMIAACALDLAMTGNDDLLASHQAGADHLRRIAGARVHATAIAAKPLGASGPGFTDATVILNNELQSLRVGAGERRVFAIDVNQNDKLIAHAEPMECVDDYAGEGAGYQWFDANGQARSVAKRSCSDLAGESVPPGRYFIVVTGPATGPSIDVAFKPYLAQR